LKVCRIILTKNHPPDRDQHFGCWLSCLIRARWSGCHWPARYAVATAIPASVLIVWPMEVCHGCQYQILRSQCKHVLPCCQAGPSGHQAVLIRISMAATWMGLAAFTITMSMEKL
jgi:hypothetical protein